MTAVLSDMGGMILRSRAHYDDLLLLQAYFGDFHTDLVGSFVGISVVCSGISKRIGLLKVLLQKNHKQAAEKHIQRLNDDVSRGSTESSALIERFVPIIRNIEHFQGRFPSRVKDGSSSLEEELMKSHKDGERIAFLTAEEVLNKLQKLK